MPSTGSYEREILSIRKPIDESVANDNTLNDDGALLLPVAAGEIVHFQVNAYWLAGAGGIRVAFNGPAAFTNLRYCISLYGAGGANVVAGAVAAWDSIAAGGANDNGTILGCGCLENGANAGNVIFRWAQNNINVANTTVYRGSHLRMIRVP